MTSTQIEMVEVSRGTQIIFVPGHVDGDTEHEDCQIGFVTGLGPDEDSVFCRYWSKSDPNDLRTKAGSELTYIRDLVVEDTVPATWVTWALEKYCTPNQQSMKIEQLVLKRLGVIQ